MNKVPKACIIGDPVAHSRSPMIHCYWLRQLGLPGSYEREQVTAADFPAFVASLRDRGYVGGNVTVPHKEAAFKAAGHVDPSAIAIGAINTLYFEGDVLVGANTDVTGFIANLDWRLPGWRTQSHRTLVIGAGGGARGVLYGLLQAGLEDISVANRTIESAPKRSPQPITLRTCQGRRLLGIMTDSCERGRSDHQHHLAWHGWPARLCPSTSKTEAKP